VAVTINMPPFNVGSNTDTIFYWNGSGVINFQPISAVQPGVDMSLDPNPIATTSASGALHEHTTFQLDNGGAGVPSDGVYLIAPTASIPGLRSSSRFFMVWLVDSMLQDEEAAEAFEEALEIGQSVYQGKDFSFFEDAVDFVQNHIVPEPPSGLLSLLALAGVTATACSRRGQRT
jgi:hypothetical protein